MTYPITGEDVFAKLMLVGTHGDSRYLHIFAARIALYMKKHPTVSAVYIAPNSFHRTGIIHLYVSPTRIWQEYCYRPNSSINTFEFMRNI